MSQAHYARIADLYDSFVKTDFDVQFFLDEAHQRGGEILELMAGTGRLTLPLIEAGIPVTAVDFSAEMLARLSEKLESGGLSANVHQADIRDLSLGRTFDQVWIPFQAFPELTSAEDQLRALRRIHEHLTDDGVFICTLHNPPVRMRSVDGQTRMASNQILPSGERLILWLVQTADPASGVVEVHEFFEIYGTDGQMTAKRYSILHFHLLEKSAFEERFLQAGFEPIALYGNYDRSDFDVSASPFMIWVLRKRR